VLTLETAASLRRCLPHLQINECIGMGGDAEVYRATDTRLSRDVAIKVFELSPKKRRSQIERFRREARALAALNHDRIVTLHNAHELDSACALIMEYLPGPTLAERLDAGPIPTTDALAIAKHIAEALEAVHDAGAQDTKLLDFGIASVFETDPIAADPECAGYRGLESGDVLGTVPYMSPEQTLGWHLDARTDVWSFGCVLYEMLVGRSPFLGQGVAGTLINIQRHEPDWDAVPQSVPRGMLQFLQGLLQKDRDRRVGTMPMINLIVESFRIATEKRATAGAESAAEAASILPVKATAERASSSELERALASRRGGTFGGNGASVRRKQARVASLAFGLILGLLPGGVIDHNDRPARADRRIAEVKSGSRLDRHGSNAGIHVEGGVPSVFTPRLRTKSSQRKEPRAVQRPMGPPRAYTHPTETTCVLR
jgi:hypothetical protein